MIIDAHAHIFDHECRKVAPAKFADGRFPIERLLELMDREGVDKAVIVQNPTIGTINEEVQAALNAYPDRFAGVIQVDPLAHEAPTVLMQYSANPRQRTVKLEMSEEWGWSGIHPGMSLDSGTLRPFWNAVDELKLNVIVDPGAVGNPGYQVEEIDALSGTYTGICFLLEHLGYLEKRNQHDPAARKRRLEVLNLAQKPNVFLGLAAVPILLEEDYPCRGAVELLQEAVELVGAGKILWGTDIPLTLRRYRYRQMIDVVLREASFLPDTDRRKILGENAARLFFDM